MKLISSRSKHRLKKHFFSQCCIELAATGQWQCLLVWMLLKQIWHIHEGWVYQHLFITMACRIFTLKSSLFLTMNWWSDSSVLTMRQASGGGLGEVAIRQGVAHTCPLSHLAILTGCPDFLPSLVRLLWTEPKEKVEGFTHLSSTVHCFRVLSGVLTGDEVHDSGRHCFGWDIILGLEQYWEIFGQLC